MPNQIISEEGPFRRPGGGYFKVVERIDLGPDVVLEDSPSVTQDSAAPECWIRKIFPRRAVNIETYQIVHYEAVEKSLTGGEKALLIGLGVLVILGGIATGGLLWAAAGATATAATTALAGGAAFAGGVTLASGKVFVDKASEAAADASLEDPDDWEMSSTVISTNGPFQREVNVRQLSSREFYLVYDCDRPITGDVGEDIGSGVSVGDEPIGEPPDEPTDDEPVDEPSDGSSTAPVDSGSDTAPVDSGSSTTPTGSGSTGG